jgi:peroxiredoxin
MRAFCLLFLSVGLLAGLTACGSDNDDPSPEQAPKTNAQARSGPNYAENPVPVPDLTLRTLDDRTIDLADQDGKVILINFWATWCAPCRKEIPDLIDLYDDLKSEGLLVVGVATDNEGASVVTPFVEREHINYPIVTDTSRSVESQFDAMYGLPTTYVVNPEGQIVRRILGIFPTEEMRPTLEAMLSEANET